MAQILRGNINMVGGRTGRQSQVIDIPTVGTTGASTAYWIAPESGVIESVTFTGVDTLATHDSNYVTFEVVNIGTGSGTTACLAATAANTSKITGGSAVTANTARALTLHGTAANLKVVAKDRMKVVVTATGTLANTITFPSLLIRYKGA